MSKDQRRQVDPFNADDPIMPWDNEAEHVAIEESGDRGPAHEDCWLEDEGRKHEETSSHKDARRSKAPSPKRAGTAGNTPNKASEPRARGHKWDQKGVAAAFGEGLDKLFATGGPKPKGRRLAARRQVSGKDVRKACLVFFVIFLCLGMLEGMVSCVADDVFDAIAERLESTTDPFDLEDEPDAEQLDYETYERVRDALCDGAAKQLEARVSDLRNGSWKCTAQDIAAVDDAFSLYETDMTLSDLGIDTQALTQWILSTAELDTARGDVDTYAFSASEGDLTWEVSAYASINSVDTHTLLYELASRVNEARAAGSTGQALAAEAQDQLDQVKQAWSAGQLSTTSYLSIEFMGFYYPDGDAIDLLMDEQDWKEVVRTLLGATEMGRVAEA